MKTIIYNNKGEEVWSVSSDYTKENFKEAHQYFAENYVNKEITSVEMILEDNMTIEDFNNALSEGDGIGVVKTQILRLK